MNNPIASPGRTNANLDQRYYSRSRNIQTAQQCAAPDATAAVASALSFGCAGGVAGELWR